MVKHHRGAVRSVMDMSLYLLLLLSGIACSASGLQRMYHFVNEKVKWAAAQIYCRENFIDLATVDSVDDVNKLLNEVDYGHSGSVWIGLKRGGLGRWGWSMGDDTISQYSSWGSGNPDGTVNCGYFASGYWYSLNCTTPLLFACYSESTGYHLISHSKNWTDAQSYCRNYYTDVAVARNSTEQNQLNGTAGDRSPVWIGLMLDPWLWSDRWNRYFRNWADGYPTEFGECVAMSDSGKWMPYKCYKPFSFICYGAYAKMHIVRLNLSCDGRCNLNDTALQTAVLNEIRKRLQGVGLGSYISLNWGGN